MQSRGNYVAGTPGDDRFAQFSSIFQPIKLKPLPVGKLRLEPSNDLTISQTYHSELARSETKLSAYGQLRHMTELPGSRTCDGS